MPDVHSLNARVSLRRKDLENQESSAKFGFRMNDMGKLLVVAGLLLAAMGALLWSGYGRGWLGRLPGDIHYSRGHFNFNFPIVTCLLASVILTLLLWLFKK